MLMCSIFIFLEQMLLFEVVFLLKTNSSNRILFRKRDKTKSRTSEVRSTAVLAMICSKMSSINGEQMIYNP